MMLHGIKAVVFDLDGVLRRGPTAIPNADCAVEWLKKKGYKMLIVTNECRWHHEDISELLRGLGMPYAAELNIYTAGKAVSSYLSSKKAKRRISVGVLGEPGLERVINECEINDKDAESKYLVIGTLNNVTEEHICFADKWVKDGAKIVVTCIDTSDPDTTSVMTMPLELLKNIDTSSTSIKSTGKPSSDIGDAIREYFQCDANEILFVGDTMETDIQLATRCGFRSVLVLTGNTRDEQELSKYSFQPDYVLESLVNIIGC